MRVFKGRGVLELQRFPVRCRLVSKVSVANLVCSRVHPSHESLRYRDNSEPSRSLSEPAAFITGIIDEPNSASNIATVSEQQIPQHAHSFGISEHEQCGKVKHQRSQWPEKVSTPNPLDNTLGESPSSSDGAILGVLLAEAAMVFTDTGRLRWSLEAWLVNATLGNSSRDFYIAGKHAESENVPAREINYGRHLFSVVRCAVECSLPAVLLIVCAFVLLLVLSSVADPVAARLVSWDVSVEFIICRIDYDIHDIIHRVLGIYVGSVGSFIYVF
ncbi:unnamed protein product [Polarella glacialis]|uniref:Uncharacterized protein n=1 Tax=Polarella glacialis TaxID=89957 RepID=A0A813LYE8_POLGL|nr:unnamed protein product [Polarella glacialis]